MKWLSRRCSSYLKLFNGVLKRVAASDLHVDGPVCQVEDLQQTLLSRCRLHHCFLADTITDTLVRKTHFQLVSHIGGLSIISDKQNTLRVKSCVIRDSRSDVPQHWFPPGWLLQRQELQRSSLWPFSSEAWRQRDSVMCYVGIGGVKKQEWMTFSRLSWHLFDDRWSFCWRPMSQRFSAEAFFLKFFDISLLIRDESATFLIQVPAKGVQLHGGQSSSSFIC